MTRGGRTRSSAPARGQRRACVSSAALVVVASSSVSRGVWWPGVRQQAVSRGQRGFAAHPAVAPEKEQRWEREKEEEKKKKEKKKWAESHELSFGPRITQGRCGPSHHIQPKLHSCTFLFLF